MHIRTILFLEDTFAANLKAFIYAKEHFSRNFITVSKHFHCFENSSYFSLGPHPYITYAKRGGVLVYAILHMDAYGKAEGSHKINF